MGRNSPAIRTTPVPMVFLPNGIALIESRHGNAFSMEFKKDGFHKLALVLEGSGRLHMGNRFLGLQAPGLAVIPRDLKHKFVDDPGNPLWIYLLGLKSPVFPGAALISSTFKRPCVFHDSELAMRAATTLRRMLFETRSPSPESPDYQLGLAALLLVDIIRLGGRETSGGESHSRMRAYVAELRQTFWMQETVGMAAARLGLSERHFSNLFRAGTGTTWLDYVRGLRMAHAARLLRETSLPIKSVAFECGYNNISHFYRLFMHTHLVTPHEWRAQGISPGKPALPGEKPPGTKGGAIT